MTGGSGAGILGRMINWRRHFRHLEAIASDSGETLPPPDMIRFRQEIQQLCGGEEPTIWLGIDADDPVPEEPGEMELTDFLAICMLSRRAFLYGARQDHFERIAATHPADAALPGKHPLFCWLFENGPLVRSHLTLKGLSAADSEALLKQLDRLGVNLVIPIPVNGGLWGILALDTPRAEEPGLFLYMGLYGLSLLQAAAQARAGLPSRQATRALRETREMEELQAIWRMVRPRGRALRLLILDEEPDAAEWMARFFEGIGFEAVAFSTTAEAEAWIKRRKPDLAILDLSFQGRMPANFLERLKNRAPEAPWIGLTAAPADRPRGMELALSVRYPVRRVLRKPITLTRLAIPILQMALEREVRKPVPSNRCLVIDEADLSGPLIREHLERLGARAWGCAIEAEALTLAAREKPDWIFLDTPPVSGNAGGWIRKLRAASPTSRLVLLATETDAHSKRRDRNRPDAVWLKPFPLERLDSAVEPLSRKERHAGHPGR
ncbi:MAG: hypothetical protein COV76_01860 [Candidatus Omnitrophica bacterium CG11_big_fil_rev_8_21_14_0_20_64_10]|nr:MAG: hypothetical protein COV76_01860 [Candidatus Omnitrophica bacterium CG11_big_fil_rev_8_21_14_0_20_64_10]